MRLRAFALPLLLVASAGLPAVRGLQAQDDAPNVAHTPGMQVQVLDAPGVDLDPYLKHLMEDVHAHWLPPAAAGKSETDISIAIGQNGTLDAVHLETSASDEATTKAAWAAITETKYAPLPSGMREPTLRLRLRFFAG